MALALLGAPLLKTLPPLAADSIRRESVRVVPGCSSFSESRVSPILRLVWIASLKCELFVLCVARVLTPTSPICDAQRSGMSDDWHSPTGVGLLWQAEISAGSVGRRWETCRAWWSLRVDQGWSGDDQGNVSNRLKRSAVAFGRSAWRRGGNSFRWCIAVPGAWPGVLNLLAPCFAYQHLRSWAGHRTSGRP